MLRTNGIFKVCERIIVCILVIAMMASFVPLSVFAEEGSIEQSGSENILLQENVSSAEISLADMSYTYTGSPIQMTGAVCIPATLTFTYKYKNANVAGDPWIDTAPTNVGTYKVKAVFAGNAEFQAVESNEATLTILKAKVTITLANRTETYTGGRISMSGAVFSPIEVPGAYYIYKPLIGTEYKNKAPKEIGEYNVKMVIDVKLSPNFEATESNEAILSIVKARAKVAITLNGKTFRYTGNPIQMSGAVCSPTHVPVSYKFKNKSVPDAQWVDVAPAEIGEYSVKAVFLGNDEYEPAESNEAIIKIENIAAATITLTDKTLNYTGNPIAMTGAISTPADLQYTYKYKAKNIENDTWKDIAPTEIGEYYVKAVFAGNEFLDPAESNTVIMTICKVYQSLTTLSGAKATSSSYFDKSTPDTVIDRNVSEDKYSWTASKKGALPHWVKIELPSEQTISKYVLHHNGVFGDDKYNPASFKVSVSSDDVNWTPVNQIENNIYEVTQRVLSAPVTARYFKIEYTFPEQYFNQVINSMLGRLAEVELFSEADAVSTLYQQTPVITLSNRTIKYTGTPVSWYESYPVCAIAYSGGIQQIPYTFMYRKHGTDEEFTSTAPSQLGSYDVKAVFGGNETYNKTESNTALLDIIKPDINISLDSRTFDYTGSRIPMSGAVSYPTRVAYYYMYKELTKGAEWTNIPPKEVGTYKVKAVFDGNDEALAAESTETTMIIRRASTRGNWNELKKIIEGHNAQQLEQVDSWYLKDKYMESGMLMGNGAFGVISDARKNEQSYFFTSGDAWRNPKRDGQRSLVNAQLKMTNAEPYTNTTHRPQFTFSSTPEKDTENMFFCSNEYAFDSNENSEWISESKKVSQETKLPRSNEKWVSVQSTKPFTFNKIEMKHHSIRFPDEAKYNLYDYDIQVSNDGSTWTTIKSVKANTDSINTFEFDTPITCSYLRVFTTTPVDPQYATLHIENDMTSARITDINLFDKGVNVINPPKAYDGKFLHERDILNAEIRSKMEYNTNNLINYKTWVADDQNSMFTDVSLDSSAAGPQRINIQLTAPTLDGIENKIGTDGDAIWLTRNGEVGYIFRGATVVKVVSGSYSMVDNKIVLTLKPGETAKIATVLYTHSGLKTKAGEGSIIVTKDMETVKNIAVQKANNITEQAIKASQDYHLNWWKEYWLKSYINIEEETVEDFYYQTLYILGCAIRQTPDWAEQPNIIGGLNGIFHSNDDTAATGNAVLNYNFEAPFYGVYSSNRGDMTQPYFASAINTLSYYQNETARFGYKGVQIDRTIQPLGAFYGKYAPIEPTGEKEPKLSSDQKSNIGLYLKPFIWDWQYTQNTENLKNFIYPQVKDLAKFYCDFVVREADGRYYIKHSSEHEAGIDTNSAIDMGYFKACLQDFIDMAEYLQQDAELVAECKDVIEKLGPFSTSKNHQITIDKLKALGFNHEKEVFVASIDSTCPKQIIQFDLPWAEYISNTNQPTLLEGFIHPGEFMSMGSDPELVQIAKNTFEYLNPMTPHTDGGVLNGFPKTFTIAARLGVDADKLLTRFSTTLKTIYNNKLYYDTTASYENCGALETIDSMLLQNEMNEMRIFPSWSKKYDAKFVDVVAKGAFRVSGELKDGEVKWAEIISDAGNDVTLVSPWSKTISIIDKNGNAVPVIKGITKNTNETTYTFKTTLNGVYTLTGTNAAMVEHSISVATTTGGSISVDITKASKGATVNVTATPESGKKLKQGSLKYTDGANETIITGTSFTMPDSDVVVGAEFEDVSAATILSEIEVTTLPTKTQYKYDEALDTTGMVVTAKYSDNSNAAITGYTVSGYDQKVSGEQIITVTYNGKTVTYKVTVKEKPVTPPDSDSNSSNSNSSSTNTEIDKVIQVKNDTQSGKSTIQIPKKQITMDEYKKDIVIKTDIGTITVPDNMFGKNDLISEKVQIVLKKVPVANVDVSGEVNCAIDIEVKDGTKDISLSNSNSSIQISIDYKPTGIEEKDYEKLAVKHIKEDGTVEDVFGVRYDAITGKQTFELQGSGRYVMMYVDKNFEDIGSTTQWAQHEIEVLAAKGIVNGTSETTFNPENNITRGDFMLMLIKTLGIKAKVSENFNDVKASDYYYQAVGIAKALGFTAGVGDNNFKPNTEITRQDMMVLAAKAMEYAKKLKLDSNESRLDKYRDKESIADYAAESIAALVESGLVTGYDAHIYPLDKATRAETAVIMYNIYNK